MKSVLNNTQKEFLKEAFSLSVKGKIIGFIENIIVFTGVFYLIGLSIGFATEIHPTKMAKLVCFVFLIFHSGCFLLSVVFLPKIFGHVTVTYISFFVWKYFPVSNEAKDKMRKKWSREFSAIVAINSANAKEEIRVGERSLKNAQDEEIEYKKKLQDVENL